MSRSQRVSVVLGALLSTLVGCTHGMEGARAVRDGTPRDPGADDFVAVAEAASRMGDNLRAQQYLTAALRAGADERTVVPRLLALYVEDGQYRLAIDAAEHFMRRHPEARDVRLLLSTLYTAVGENDRAIAGYERILDATPGDAYAHFALASLLHDQGGASLRADEHFRAYLALAPEGEHAAEARGLLLRGVP